MVVNVSKSTGQFHHHNNTPNTKMGSNGGTDQGQVETASTRQSSTKKVTSHTHPAPEHPGTLGTLVLAHIDCLVSCSLTDWSRLTRTRSRSCTHQAANSITSSKLRLYSGLYKAIITARSTEVKQYDHHKNAKII